MSGVIVVVNKLFEKYISLEMIKKMAFILNMGNRIMFFGMCNRDDYDKLKTEAEEF